MQGNEGVRRRDRAWLLLPAISVGVLLPLDFLGAVDGYAHYLRIHEILEIFAVAFLLYAGLGLTGTAFSRVIASGIRLIRRNSPLDFLTITVWLSSFLSVLVVLRAGRDWLVSSDLIPVPHLGGFKWGIVALVGVLCTWLVRTRRLERTTSNLLDLSRLTVSLSLATALIGLAAMVVTVGDRPPSLTPRLVGTTSLAERRPNIILITMDAFSSKRASLYGHRRLTTPYLERFSAKAFVFDRFYANANATTPSVNSILTGVRPWSHRTFHLDARLPSRFADESLMALAHKSQFHVITVSTNPSAAPAHSQTARFVDESQVGRVRSSRLRWIGFGELWSPTTMPLAQLGTLSRAMDVLDRIMVVTGLWPVNGHFDPELALADLRASILRRPASRPIFAWVHLFPPHDPYSSPEPFLGMFSSSNGARARFDSSPDHRFQAANNPQRVALLADRYDESIRYVDHHVGAFLSWLETKGYFDDSIIVITSDHGESFSRGYGGHEGPLLHEDLLRIPLLVHLPGQKIGRRISAPSEQVDLLPTLAELAGFGPVSSGVEGQSLVPILRGESVKRGPIFAMNFEQNRRHKPLEVGSVAEVDGQWKYVHYLGHPRYPGAPRLQDELYDVVADPDEGRSLVAARPDVAATMLTAIRKKVAEKSATGSPP